MVDKDFNINAHPMFSKTRLVLKVVLNNSGKQGANKKRKKSPIIIEEMEKAVLANIDHQIFSSHGC